MKKGFIFIIALLLLLTSCGQGTRDEASSMHREQVDFSTEENSAAVVEEESKEKVKIPQQGGTLYMSMENQEAYNPLLTMDANAAQILNLVFSPLIDWDEQGRANPAIASGWSLSEDNMEATLTIDTSIQWHNGKAVSPGDVVFTINTLIEAETSLYKKCVENIESAHVLNENSLRIVFNEPSALNLNKLYFPVISQDYYNGTQEEMLGHTEEPMGSGPYRLESYIPMKEMTLSVNDTYYGTLPYIEKIVIQLSYSDVRQVSFNQKLSNIVYLEDISWGEYVGRENVKLHVFSSNEAIMLAFNTKAEAMADVNTRKAIAYALDADAILANTNLDKGDVTEIPFAPEYWYAPTDPSLYSYNQQKVAELLDLSQETTLRFLVNGDDVLETEIAAEIQSNLESLGILIDRMEKNEEEYKSMLSSGGYDLALISESLVDMTDLKKLLSVSMETEDETEEADESEEEVWVSKIFNSAHYESDVMNALLETAGQKTQEHEIHQAMVDIGNLMEEDLPYYSMFVLKQAVLTGKGVYGELHPMPYNVYRGIENLYIEYTEE